MHIYYQKADWTSFKQHVENLISYRPHNTNVHEANKHLSKAILDTNRFFIPKGNHNSTNRSLTHAYLQAYSLP